MANDNPPWRPLRERMAGLTDARALVEGTPPYLLDPLRKWLDGVVFSPQPDDIHSALQLKLRRSDIARWSGRIMVISVEGDDLLEAIDATLDLHAWLCTDDSYANAAQRKWWAEQLVSLTRTLDQAGSAWKVKDSWDGLTTRVDETVAQAVNTTISDTGSDASAHLRKAWDAAYGIQPDPTVAYSEAVKAAEAVTIPAVLPRDRGATLGKVLGEMKNTRARWTLSIDDKVGQPASADAVIEMIALLWHGQRDRHSGPEMKLTTLEAARMAVHTAATLVQWFTSGNVHRS
ncbi:hypothetical protein GCM10027187_40070 [Streptosporangium sandarakinum]|uniref:Uncharacterized protein n=1 Tax=Streptosporangium sandarakinum TaxID=1260955 RepID=A0A852VE54_9ACTN|nr:hypothetical protein [Streptosporangium sandarakinum]NYF44661.1 hypothetical protein [Streptosporangium sandarakinum]